MTDLHFLTDAYAQSLEASVEAITEAGIVCDRTIFYAQGGGQPGDSGRLVWDGGEIGIVNTIKGEAGAIALVPAEGTGLPQPGARITQILDWDRRHRHMRVHTALHLLSVVVPLPVTGGQIAAEKGRLDFNMPDAPEDKDALEADLNALIARDLPVTETWITDAELEANPSLVKTMSVQPPKGAGRVRLVRIGTEEAQVDLQPCGGTHVRSTAEIGPIRLGKVEKKGRQNRRMSVLLT